MPLSGDAIEKAIELNGEAVEMNLAAFGWGRRAAAEPAAIDGARGARARRRRDRARCRRRSTRSSTRRVALPHRLPGRRLCASAIARCVERVRAAEAAGGARRDGAHRGGRPLSVQADGLQGRVRGGAALHRRRVSRSSSPRPSRARPALRVPSRAAAPRQARPGDRPAAEDELRPVDDEGLPACSRSCKGLRGTPFDPFGYTARAPQRSAG